MSAQNSCLSLIKYLLFVFNLFFFVSCLMATQLGPQPLPQVPQPSYPYLPTTVFVSSPQVLGSLIFCFGIWILVDKTSFVSFVGEGARAAGEGLPEADVDPASWGLPCPREPHGTQLPRQVSGSAVPLPTGPCHTSLSLSAFL